MSDNLIITIGRQLGSGGRDIGKKLAEDFGISYYDKELLREAAKESGLAEELFNSQDEKPTSSFLYSLVMDAYSFGYTASGYNEMPLNHRVFLAQFDAIKTIAEREPCVIVGRAADYALADYPGCIKVYIYANEDYRIKRISESFNISESAAKDEIRRTDKQRASYYNFYTNKKWGDAGSYDLCIDSSKLGTEGAEQLIKEYVKLRQEILSK